MWKGRFVKRFSDGFAVRHDAQEKRPEAVAVIRMKQVRQLMGKYIIEADRRLLDKLQIQPDALCRGVAGTPAGFHVFDLNTRRMKSCFSFPVRQARANPCVQLCAVKAVQKRLPLCGRIARMDLQNDVPSPSKIASAPKGTRIEDFNAPMTIFVTSLSGSKALVNFTIDDSKSETSFVDSIVYNIERKVKLRYRSQL